MHLYTSKYAEVQRLLSQDIDSVLDIGCRDTILRTHLSEKIKYFGIDLQTTAKDTLICNAEIGLPFTAKSFDAVVSLDMLEHTENIWGVFSEFVRVARRQIIIVLPNSYHWKSRHKFIRGKEGDKYKLSCEPIQDRHRWLTSYTTSKEFAIHMAEKFNMSLSESIMVDEEKNWRRELLAKFFSPNLMSVAVLFSFSLQNP